MSVNFDDIKNKIVSYKQEIKTFFKDNGKTIPNITKLSETLLEKEFGNKMNEYNQKTKKFNEYMVGKETELNEIEKEKKDEKKKLDIVSKRLNRSLELLKNEESSLEEIDLNLNEYKSVLLNFKDRFDNNTTKIDDLIKIISKYEQVVKDEFTEELEVSKKEIHNYFEEEHKKIIRFLEEKSKEIIEDKFNIEKLKLTEEKREAFRFEGRIFIKYILLFLLFFGVAIIDFLLIKGMIELEFKDSEIREDLKVILINIISALPSFVLIFFEFFSRKYLKKMKVTTRLIHGFSLVAIVVIIFSVVYTYDYERGGLQIVGDFNPFALLARILIFTIAIPGTIAIWVKFFKTDEFFDFVRHLFLPFIFAFLSIKYFFESFVLKDKKKKLFKESYVFKLDLSELNLLINKKHKLDNIFSIPRTFHEDLDQIGIKTEKALANIKDLQSFLSKNEESKQESGFWSRFFGNKINSNIIGTVDGRIEKLKEGIKGISKDIEEQEKSIDKKYQGSIDNINVSINLMKKNRQEYKSQYEKNKRTIEKAINEVITEFLPLVK